MTTTSAQPFANNWAYLKTELRWLDRLLMVAVSRQRQHEKVVDRVAQTAADHATSHWWKGIVAVKQGIYDEGPPPKPSATKSVPYGEHLETCIQASTATGVCLALPYLRDRLALTTFEKNLVLMAMAPEINRRYGRLYDFLQEEAGALEDLPTVDLCLRLLCRNDQAWQQARSRLTATDSLVQRGVVEWVGDNEGTLLSQQVRVTEPLLGYLIAEAPTPAQLDMLLTGDRPPLRSAIALTDGQDNDAENEGGDDLPHLPRPEATAAKTVTQPLPSGWDHLALPRSLLKQLQYLSRQAAQRQQAEAEPGLVVLLLGEAGTGKTSAAGAIAADLGQPLSCVDLTALAPEQYPDVLTALPHGEDGLLLVQHGEQWFGRNAVVDGVWLSQWWQWRRQFHGLTLVSAPTLQAVRPRWRHRFDGILSFPQPDVRARRQLWAQAFPEPIKTRGFTWEAVAKQLPLSGGDITEIARMAWLDLQARQKTTLTLRQLETAIALRHPHLRDRVKALSASPRLPQS
ncbi:MAG: hypothetical protein IGR92_02170 [Leptolyngbyaceae cyanobacterium T60_A2020_046]|nr:hypothetical protein [Leptolyngbyaceae cyanobacterium T60_A2020_046]